MSNDWTVIMIIDFETFPGSHNSLRPPTIEYRGAHFTQCLKTAYA